MPQWLRCIRCGKILFFGPRDAGQRLICIACGTLNEVPPVSEFLPGEPAANPPIIPPPITLGGEPTLRETPLEDAALANTLRPAFPSPLVPQRTPTSVSRPLHWLWISAACVAAFILGVCVTIIAFRLRGGDNGRGGDSRLSQAAPSVAPTTQHATTTPSEAHRPPATLPAQTRPAITARIPGKAVTLQPATAPATRPTVIARVVPPADPPRPQKIDPPAPIRPSRSVRPPVRPVALAGGGLTDEQIGQAIRRGADYLLGQFGDAPTLRRHVDSLSDQYAGANALCVYALLQCGQAINDERLNVRGKQMKAMLAAMRDMSVPSTYETYTRGIRATALAVFNRPEDRGTLREDVGWLVRSSRHGAYHYTESGTRLGSWDNSNSQYGLLGVWSGAEVGAEVPQDYWLAVQNHWYECQYTDGEWGYVQPANGQGTLSMTLAGLASLLVTHDYLDAPMVGGNVGRAPFGKPLARGLAWLESGDNCLRQAWNGYTLYGVERVGLASGFKYFGEHDWYRRLAEQLIRNQRPDGSWISAGGGASRDDLVGTAYSLLFLARGRHPILMNKLRFDGSWANRPRDMANLARFASRELERPLNWQVVPLHRDWTDWMDSPVLYMSSHQPPSLTGDDIDNLRRFILAGGLLFTQSDGGSESFNSFVVDLQRKLFPQYEWADLPADHELYSLHYRVDPKPALRYVSNGSRILMLHSPRDISQAWQARAEKTRRNTFELGVNIFVYAAGKADLRNRLVSTYLPPLPGRDDAYHVKLGRIRYPGEWNPEPAAFERFGRYFGYRTGYALDISEVDAADLRADACPIAHLTGTAPFAPSDEQIAALKKYVADGGVLIIDACGGSQAFAQSIVSGLIPRAFGGAQLELFGADHPLFTGRANGMEPLLRAQVRTVAEMKIGRNAGALRTLRFGKGRVVFSQLDMTSGLLGTNTWGVVGYQSGYAQALLKNLMLWTADGCPDRADDGKGEP